MASSKSHHTLPSIYQSNPCAAKIPMPKEPQEDAADEAPLPQTLVRIPTEQAPLIQQHQDAAREAANDDN